MAKRFRVPKGLSEDILAGPHNFKSLFEGEQVVLGLGLELDSV